MALDTNFNLNPYYDDFDEAKKYLRLLFKPGYAVQARELTQIQSLLQNQVARFGDHIFKNGSVVTGGQFYLQDATYLKLNTSARCILCFVVQRHDAATFELSATDPEYADAVRYAISVGVEVYAIFIRWSLEGHAYLHNILPVQ